MFPKESQLASHAKASQDIIPIEEIRDGVVILKDGSLRAVLMASSLNFALKSPNEQDAIILQYQNFLNSLDFSVQFFIQSRKLNIDSYLDSLRERHKIETNELLRIQISEYVTFVRDFVESNKIVSKAFYIVVPFTPGVGEALQRKSISHFFNVMLGKKSKTESTFDAEKFAEYKIQLQQRMDTVIAGLVRTGVRVVALDTSELIELYYGLYNPEQSEKGKAPVVQSLTQKTPQS